MGHLLDQDERLKSSIRTKAGYPFRVLKCQLGVTKVGYKGLVKNTPTDNTVCPEQLVDGQEEQYSKDCGMSASAKREIARQTDAKATQRGQFAQNFDKSAFCDSLNNCLTANSRFGAGCADHP